MPIVAFFRATPLPLPGVTEETFAKGGVRLTKQPNGRGLTPLEESYKWVAPPEDLTEEEHRAWEEFLRILKTGTRYKKTLADAELIRQYVQHKVMRDRAWKEWIRQPDRYIRIVTGLCADGVTPKIVVKENEHYRVLQDCNRYIEKLWNDLKLTPAARPG